MGDIVGKEIGSKAKTFATEGIDKLKRVDWKSQGDKARAMTDAGIEKLKKVDWSTLGEKARICCRDWKEKVVAIWKSGTKGKMTIAAGTCLILWISSCLFGEGDVSFSELSTDSFSTVFWLKEKGAENGVAYRHFSDPSIQVISVCSDGVLVAYIKGANPFTAGLENFFDQYGESMEKIVYVETELAKKYSDGVPLGAGYYLRDGMYSYESAGGIKRTVVRFVELTDNASIEKCHEIEKMRKDQESEEALKAEGAPIDVDVPVKSLCGFVLGTTPSQSWDLFKENQGRAYTHKRSSVSHYEIKGTLKSPFRMFIEGKAEYTFEDNVPERLYNVELSSESIDFNKTSRESCISELKKVADLLHEKFNIKLVKKERAREFPVQRCQVSR